MLEGHWLLCRTLNYVPCYGGVYDGLTMGDKDSELGAHTAWEHRVYVGIWGVYRVLT